MSGYEFTETLTISVPNIEEQLSAFSESEYKANHNLIIEVAAIHEGMTANYNYYPEAALAESVQSWVSPYPKPIIMNHDAYSEPVGRVMAAKMAKEADGTPYVRLQVAVTDPEAVRKVMDQRYLTGSVGGKAEEAVCNICGADWAKASMLNMPCRHQRGTPYKGKVAHVEMRKIQFKEYSFVNMPADERSSVRQLATNAMGESVETDDDGWIRPVQVLAMDMQKEEILELTESTTHNILDGMNKKDSFYEYHQTRGAFLSAIASAETGDTTKESTVAKENEPIEEEEDILAVAEGLSSDLAATETDEVEEEEVVESDDDEAAKPHAFTDGNSDGKCDVCGGAAATHKPVKKESDDETPEAQEEPHEEDVDPDDSSNAPETRDSDEASEIVAEDEPVEEEAIEEEDSETQLSEQLSEQISALESRVEELETREQTLLQENAKLKAALKKTLAERVVDTKIALGLLEAADREASLEEHVARAASSLADTLRDLAKMPFKARETMTVPTVTELSGAVAGEENVVTADEEHEDPIDPVEKFEGVLVDALMGRRRL